MRENSKITATVISDTTYNGARVSTVKITTPKWLLAEINTHKMISRNYGSSRARRNILESVAKDPFIPSWVGGEKPGMVAREEVKAPKAVGFAIRRLSEAAVREMRYLDGWVHHQHVNRYLEPWTVVEGVLTACHVHRQLYFEEGEMHWRDCHPWSDMLFLRSNPAADPAMQDLAIKIQKALKVSIPRESDRHLPFLRDAERTMADARLVSAARCARVSYRDPSDLDEIDRDVRLAERLIAQRHASPFEHVLTAGEGVWANFSSWRSYRWDLGL